MRTLRALAHLVLVLAFVSVTAVQAQAVTCVPVASAPHQQHHDHLAASVIAEHAVHAHGSQTGDPPAHKHDNCQTVCCFTAGQAPAHAPTAETIQFFFVVRYVVDTQPVMGRALAPDPGVPKHLA